MAYNVAVKAVGASSELVVDNFAPASGIVFKVKASGTFATATPQVHDSGSMVSATPKLRQSGAWVG